MDLWSGVQPRIGVNVFIERKPRTFCRITAKGRKAVMALVKHLENLVEPG